jgi:cysteine synthase
VLAHWARTGVDGPDGAYEVEGIGSSRPGELFDRTLIDFAERVTDVESFAMTRRLWAEEGLYAGGSSGTAVVAALRIASMAPAGPVVVVLPDSWDRYLSKPWAAQP